MEPHASRRWFLKHHGITFQAYQRMFRINSAFKKIQEGESVAATAFEAGFESLSGFNDSFKSIFGVSPSKNKDQKIITVKRIESPLGTLFAAALPEGICLLEFSDRKMLETELKQLAKTMNALLLQGHSPYFDQLEKQLGEYFEGKRKAFTVPLFAPGSAFQQQVWAQLGTIPYGETRSYKEQASFIDRPNAVRAVARANGMNRISILIPCHRVIGSNGNLTGYNGGIWRKQWLLDLEKKQADASI